MTPAPPTWKAYANSKINVQWPASPSALTYELQYFDSVSFCALFWLLLFFKIIRNRLNRVHLFCRLRQSTDLSLCRRRLPKGTLTALDKVRNFGFRSFLLFLRRWTRDEDLAPCHNNGSRDIWLVDCGHILLRKRSKASISTQLHICWAGAHLGQVGSS